MVPRLRGKAPGTSIIITIFTWSRFSERINAAAPEGRPGGGSGTFPIDFPGKSSDYFRRDPGFRLFGYIFTGAPQRRGGAPGASRDKVTGRNRHDTHRHPPPNRAPAADQKLVLSIFRGNRLYSTGENTASDYSDISSLGAPQRRGKAPGASPIITVLYLVEIQQQDKRRQEERPICRSGTCPVNVPEKPSEYYRRDPDYSDISSLGRRSGGAKPRERRFSGESCIP
jgi:hypothetical protein